MKFAIVGLGVFVSTWACWALKTELGHDLDSFQVFQNTCGSGNDGHDSVIILLAPPWDVKRALSFRAMDGSSSKSDRELTRMALHSLKYLQDDGRAQVRIFHDKDDKWPTSLLSELEEAASPRSVCTMAIDFRRFPEGSKNLSEKYAWQTPLREMSFGGAKSRQWGYSHMIRFFFNDIFESSWLHGFKYWMRLDSDAWFTGNVSDPFQYMDNRSEIGYLHYEDHHDCGRVAEGLHEFAHQWCRKLGVEDVQALVHPTLGNGDSDPEPSLHCVSGYYNNLEVGRFSTFKTPAMQEWREAITKSGGIYRHRWGDALLRRLSVEMYKVPTAPVPKGMHDSYNHR